MSPVNIAGFSNQRGTFARGSVRRVSGLVQTCIAENWPEFPLGALRKDKHLTVKVFVIYYLREEKICRIKTALWPANFGVTDPPAMGF